MPRRAWPLRVQDILDSAADIREFVDGLDVDSFAADARTRAAVLYKLTIIGEAASQVPEEVRDRCPAVPWRRLRDTRNFVTHVYDQVDADRIWRFIKLSLPGIERQLRIMLEAEGEDET